MAKGDLSIVLDEGDYKRLQQKLEGLSKADQGQIIQKGLKEGMDIIAKEGRTNLATRNNSKTGRLKRSLGVSVNKKRKASYGGFRRPGGNVAHLVDRGTDERYTKRGWYRGSVSKGRPNTGTMFWTNAVETKGDEAVDTLMTAIYDELDRITNR